MSYLFRTAFRYTVRHFREVLTCNFPMFIAMIVLNTLVSITFLFPRIFHQLTRLQEVEADRNLLSQGSGSIGMLRFFNVVLFGMCAILILAVLFFLLSHTATVVKQFVGLEKEDLQTRYQLILDERYVFKEFFLSLFLILILGAPINYVVSIILQHMMSTRVMAFYGSLQLAFIEIWLIPIIIGGIFVVYIYWLMRKYAKNLYQNAVISNDFQAG